MTYIAGVVATAIQAGAIHTCAIVTGGAVKCWGANGEGQLGTGDTAGQTSPMAVDLGSGERCAAVCLLLHSVQIRQMGNRRNVQRGRTNAEKKGLKESSAESV